MFKILSTLVIMMTLSLNSAYAGAHSTGDVSKEQYIEKAVSEGQDPVKAESTFDGLDMNKDGVLSSDEQK